MSDNMCKKHFKILKCRINRILETINKSMMQNIFLLKAVKTQAYEALVVPHLEYACTVWDPHTQLNVRRLDAVQRRAACYVCYRWHNISMISSVST